MLGAEVKRQLPVLLTLRSNQVQETGAEYSAEEVVLEEEFTKDMVDEVDSSTDQHKHHRSETSREKLKFLTRS